MFRHIRILLFRSFAAPVYEAGRGRGKRGEEKGTYTEKGGGRKGRLILKRAGFPVFFYRNLPGPRQKKKKKGGGGGGGGGLYDQFYHF